MVHVWSILLPCVAHGWSAQVVPGRLALPLSERKPPGFKHTDANKQMISLQLDDVWRIFEMTVLLCVMMPLSLKWLSTRRHIAIHVHRLIATLYFVDIVRRHTHPHSWVLNAPVFAFWCLDKAWWLYVCRGTAVCQRLQLGANYVVIYFNHVQPSLRMVGPDYYLRLPASSFWEDRPARLHLLRKSQW